ncbi:MAG: putative Rossmann fold flavoprotein [Candidatus Latescibacterota bacterium]|jgi:predicted Rossmann fold flavoprotein
MDNNQIISHTVYDVLIIGGGAAGFFTAINAAEKNPELKIAILERGQEVLNKVKVSGGGRCNVTHAQFVPKELTKRYPRGEKELLGPFHSFMTGDTITWFEERGIALKIEEDGRMFPVSDSSQTIIDCFVKEVERFGIEVIKGASVKAFSEENNQWKVSSNTQEYICQKLVLATGSNPKIWKMIGQLGHTIIPPVPSLFTFNIKDQRILDLAGVATDVSIKVTGTNGKELLQSEGPLLITHWGMSGPAILKLSAWGARILEPLHYNFEIQINWLFDASEEDTLESLMDCKSVNPKQTVQKYAQLGMPKRLWQRLVMASGIDVTETWAEISKIKLQNLANQLTKSHFQVEGKSTFKEEFVTAGGVDLKEINFKRFESKLHPNLFFAGEVLNIDAITGGYNFQNAWTGGFMVAKAIFDD